MVFFFRRRLAGCIKIGGFCIRFKGNNSVMNSGGVVVVGTNVVVGVEVEGVVLVLLKSFKISLRVLGFSEIIKIVVKEVLNFRAKIKIQRLLNR